MTDNTIVAVTTPPGRGGVGIVRISGDKAQSIAKMLSPHLQLEPRRALYRTFLDEENEPVDQGILLFFKAPHSFTGEDVVELQVHGAPIVLDRLLQLCVHYGARLARPGEFSERAFLNDKIDLTQAEAIADLIQAHSTAAARLALRSLQGEFSQKINQLNEQIIQLRMYVEAAIDFPEEEIDFLSDGKIAVNLRQIITMLEDIQKKAHQGSLIREGLNIVIAGRPNAGKSTLINQLAGRDIAIVTEIPGTTRDVMREQILLDDIPIHLIDTAGLRESDDVVEKEGIKRARNELNKADCVLLIIDVNSAHDKTELEAEIRSELALDVPVIRIFNKIDTFGCLPKIENNDVYLCAKKGEGISLLTEKIKEIAGYQPVEGSFLARRRHLLAIQKALDDLQIGQQQLVQHRALELLAEDLRLAHTALCEITGAFSSDDLLGEIFSRFCIGK